MIATGAELVCDGSMAVQMIATVLVPKQTERCDFVTETATMGCR
jgi:glycine/serine hydroxymethyltransferase